MVALFDIIQEPRFADVCSVTGQQDIQLPPDFKDAFIAGFLKDYTPVDAPVFYHTLGFVGSGKTTVLQHYFAQTPNIVVIAFDSIMESLPFYQQDKETLGAQTAFEKWERIARSLGYEIVQQALAQKLMIALEHSGARDDHAPLLLNVKQKGGYRIVILDTTSCHEDVAFVRANARACGRFFPKEYVYERKKIVNDLLPSYRDVADEWLTFDTCVGSLPVVVPVV